MNHKLYTKEDREFAKNVVYSTKPISETIEKRYRIVKENDKHRNHRMKLLIVDNSIIDYGNGHGIKWE